jgi:competence protein ComEA
MRNKASKIHLLIFFAAIIGLTLVFGITEVCAQASKALVDLNTASEKELEEIKGVGPATAKKIIAGRPYKSVDDLKKAKVPDKTIELMKPYVKVGAAPVAVKPTAETKPTAPAKDAKETKQAAPAKSAAPPVTAKETAKEAPVKATSPATTPKTTAPVPTVPSKTPAETKAAKVPAKVKDKETPAVKLAPGQKVNINTATKEELEALPEVGPVKAQAIIDGRPYKAPEDVMKIKGIKEGTFSKIKDYITVR